MTEELYNKGIKKAIDKIRGLQFSFNEYDIVHDAILIYDGNDEAEFFKVINSMFYKNDRECPKHIPMHTATGEKKEETLGDKIDEDGKLHLHKGHWDLGWRVCTKCHEPKPIGCFHVGMQYSRGKRFISPACRECLRKQQRESYPIRKEKEKREKETLAERYVVRMIRRRWDGSEITPQDIEIRRTQIMLNRLSSIIGNGVYNNRPTYKYKRK